MNYAQQNSTALLKMAEAGDKDAEAALYQRTGVKGSLDKLFKAARVLIMGGTMVLASFLNKQNDANAQNSAVAKNDVKAAKTEYVTFDAPVVQEENTVSMTERIADLVVAPVAEFDYATVTDADARIANGYTALSGPMDVQKFEGSYEKLSDQGVASMATLPCVTDFMPTKAIITEQAQKEEAPASMFTIVRMAKPGLAA